MDPKETGRRWHPLATSIAGGLIVVVLCRVFLNGLCDAFLGWCLFVFSKLGAGLDQDMFEAVAERRMWMTLEGSAAFVLLVAVMGPLLSYEH